MKTQKEIEPLVTAADVAPLLSVSPQTVYQWAKEGKLPYYRLASSIRFKVSEIEKYIASVRCKPYSELS